MQALSLCNRATLFYALAVVTIQASATRIVAGEPRPSRTASGEDPNSPDYRPPSAKHQGSPERDKLMATIKQTLNAVKPAGTSRKESSDLFVVGTIDLENHHAIVDFVIKVGVQETAEFIADFVLDKAPGEIRQWRAFYRAKDMKAAENLRRKAKLQSVEDQLVAFKLSTHGKKSPDDYFVVGTADLNTTTQHADVRFEILSGIKDTADFITDFILTRRKDHIGEWHVFFRGVTEAQATDFRQSMRDLYDSMENQRSRIAAIYNAKTTARC